MPGVTRWTLIGGMMSITLVACTTGTPQPTPGSTTAARWWKGNTHTHSLWSDGDAYPDMIAAWYKRQGYDFLAMTDHNPPPPEKWVVVPRAGDGRRAYEAYHTYFDSAWIQERRSGDTLRVRLRPLEEYRVRLEEPGRFLMITGEEISQSFAGKAAHLNALNIVEQIPAQEGASAIEMLRRDLEAIAEQRARTGQPMIGVLNHPNFLWSQTAEDMLTLGGMHFFEVYNGHPHVNTTGDSLHASTERIWDIVQTHRLARGEPLLYGMATDDAHDYHDFAPEQRNPGRGWVMVRSPALEADALIGALERGDFYSSTGVTLTDVQRAGNRITISIDAEPGVTYTTQFIGTRLGWDPTSSPVYDSTGAALTRRYSVDVGAVLAESTSPTPTYTMRGDEVYVRARITSSRAKANPSYAGEREMAWTQPVRPR